VLEDQALPPIRRIQKLNLELVLDVRGAVTVYGIAGDPTGAFRLSTVPEYAADGTLHALDLRLECRLLRPDFDIATEDDDDVDDDDDEDPGRPTLYALPEP
jgi:hypothetical protein